MPYSHLPRGMKHVERRELYESLQARLQYLQSFLEFGPTDVEVLRKCQPFIKSIIPAIAENHYKKLLQQDLTAQALITQTTKEEADLDADDFYGPNSKNIKNRSMFIRWYLTKMNSDPTTTNYWEYMNMVGAMHAGHHRRTPLHVDVVHFTLLLGHLLNVLNEAIITSATLPTQHKAPLVKAWSKLFWIQNDLFAKWHIRDGDQYDQTSTQATKLDVDTDFGGMTDDEGRPVQCPFSSMAKVEKIENNGQLKQGYVYKSSSRRYSGVKGGIGSIDSISTP